MSYPSYIETIVTAKSVFVAHCDEYEQCEFFRALEERIVGRWESHPDEIPVPSFKLMLQIDKVAEVFGPNIVEKVVLLGDAVPAAFRTPEEEPAKQWPVLKLNTKHPLASSLLAARRAEILLNDMHDFCAFAATKSRFIDVDKTKENEANRRAAQAAKAANKVFSDSTATFKAAWDYKLCQAFNKSELVSKKLLEAVSENKYEIYNELRALPDDEKIVCLDNVFNINIARIMKNVKNQ